jgi:prevent-host-death family protein
VIVMSLEEVQSRLCELLDRVEAGESIEITRQGKVVAQLTAPAKADKPIDLASLQGLIADMPVSSLSAAELVRGMRDGDRF